MSEDPRVAALRAQLHATSFALRAIGILYAREGDAETGAAYLADAEAARRAAARPDVIAATLEAETDE